MAGTTQLIFEILDAEKERLFQYASYRLHDIKDVEDVLQNLYLKIHDNRERFIKVENKRAYIYKIIRNECSDIIRDRAKIDLENFDSWDSLELVALQPENFDEEFIIINRLLSMIPAEQSETIRLRHHSNLSFKEIAEITEVPLSTAKARYRYGIEKIRESLKTSKLL